MILADVFRSYALSSVRVFSSYVENQYVMTWFYKLKYNLFMYEYAHKIISHGNQEKKVILASKKLVNGEGEQSINQEFWLMIRSLRAAAGWSWGLIEATKPTSSLSTPSAHWSFEMCLIFLKCLMNLCQRFSYFGQILKL